MHLAFLHDMNMNYIIILQLIYKVTPISLKLVLYFATECRHRR